MLKAKDFICWGLTHAASVPAGAQLPIPTNDCCTEPWHYLFGSVRVKTTDSTIARYRNEYIKRGWKPETYDYYTKNWKSTECATDCQGLLDAYLTYECGEKTDINADMNYNYWCTEKRTATKDYGSYTIGDALFMANSKGKMTHVGWVCGFTHTGEPLVVEARGLAYGVVITRLTERPWTHTGRMTVKFNYEEEESEEQTMVKAKFEITSPMHTGAAYKAMQTALNAAGYTDGDGKALVEDGKWGAKSQSAYNSMIADYSIFAPAETNPIMMDDAATVLMHGIRITITKDGANQ